MTYTFVRILSFFTVTATPIMSYCTTFTEFQRYLGRSPRYYARRLALDILHILESPKYRENFKQPRIHFLYIHHIFEDEIANFRKLVHELATSHTFITHSEAVQRIKDGTVDKPYLAWSSDDGIQNNLNAASVLEEVGASCCFYVNPFSINLTDEGAIKQFCAEKLDMPPVPFLNWSEIEVLQKAGHEIGAHTYAHDRVSQLSLENFQEDFYKTDTILKQHCGPIQHFAYTYGTFNDCDAKAMDFVYDSGYASGTSAVRGCHPPTGYHAKEGRLLLRRDQIIGAWPISHSKYFISRSVRQMTRDNHYYPKAWTTDG